MDGLILAASLVLLHEARNWWLEQSEPGVLVWHTPAGRTYTTTPTQYARLVSPATG